MDDTPIQPDPDRPDSTEAADVAPAPGDAWLRWLPYGLIGLALLLALLTAGDYGIGWDDLTQASYGDKVLAYFQSGGADKSALNYHNLQYYGAVVELVLAAVSSLAPAHKWLLRHLLTAVIGAGGIAVVAYAARSWRLTGLAAFAALALWLHPRWYGHSYMNSKDIPFAVFFALTMALLLNGIDRELSWRRAALIGLAAGLTMAIRMGGLLVLAFALGIAVLVLARRYWLRTLPTDRRWWLLTAAKVGLLLLVAWVATIATWPWALQEPFTAPLEAFRYANKFPIEHVVFFQGRFHPSTGLPRLYLPQILAITVPLPILILAVCGLIGIGRDAIRAPRDANRLRDAGLLLWVFFPICYVLITRPSLYDGMRHFLFLLPALALLAARGGAWLLQLLGARAALRRATAVLLLLALALPAIAIYRLHPYQYIYYNRIAGGIQQAQFGYDSDYWLLSYREGMAWLNAEAAKHPQQELVVAVAGNSGPIEIATIYQAPNIRIVPVWLESELPPAQDFHFFLATTRYQKALFYPRQPIAHRVGPQGVILSVIRRGAMPLPGDADATISPDPSD